MCARYVQKKSKDEGSVEQFNLNVLRKQNKTIQRIEKKISFGVFLVYDFISDAWTRAQCEGPLFLVRKDNAKLMLIFMNQLSSPDNKQIDIGDHMQFELKKQQKQGRTDYYLNIKRPDSLIKTEIFGIWSEDPQLQAIYQVIKQNK